MGIPSLVHRLLLAGIVGAGQLAAAGPDLARDWPRTDFSTTTVSLGEFRSGGPPKDGIPAIDEPRFVPPRRADAWLDGREPVVALEISGHARAYPLQILIYHEIVNDRVGDTPVAVTFCPLCNAAMVFDRRVAGRELDFGTTGRLRKSDLVMYDRQTQSWWQQFTGEALVGHYAGRLLTPLPATIISYQDFKRFYPHGEILSRDTGYRRPYGRNPYRGYDRVGETPFLFDDPTDPRLPAMERVLAVQHGSKQRLYPYTLLKDRPVINDQLADLPVVILSTQGMRSALDRVRITESRLIPAAAAYSRRLGERTLNFRDTGGSIRDRETGSIWAITGQALEGPLMGERLEPLGGGVHFAFAWLAFHPDSEIYATEH